MERNTDIWILNGPNLNLVGRRNPAIYGTISMEQIVVDIQRRHPDLKMGYRQSNHEGDLIDWVQQAVSEGIGGIVLNAGGYTHTSVALRDAVEYAVEQGIKIVEVHISNIYAREEFRRVSLLADVCSHRIIGHGPDGYNEAVTWLIGI